MNICRVCDYRKRKCQEFYGRCLRRVICHPNPGGVGQASTPPGDLHAFGSSVFVHGDMSEPFEVDRAL